MNTLHQLIREKPRHGHVVDDLINKAPLCIVFFPFFLFLKGPTIVWFQYNGWLFGFVQLQWPCDTSTQQVA